MFGVIITCVPYSCMQRRYNGTILFGLCKVGITWINDRVKKRYRDSVDDKEKEIFKKNLV